MCGVLRACTVIDHFRVSHLYFVPLGRGRYQFSTRACRTCGTVVGFDAERYAEVVPAEEANGLVLEELLRRTQPGLAARLDAIDALKGEVQGAADDEPSSALFSEAGKRLRWLERRGVDTTRWVERLRQWPRLGLDARRMLVGELRGYATRLREER